ncbi:MAG: D-sedoheptulose-7-phosphate isomerase [Candidatus Loosdrechtia sp.]|uniref:D-sedoheptulose-7-phosphate isomerase n=1 Tax=Candidatus Loosdrechtia sp. TaxID=3101272 RepID=UPI003A71E098|nr:MAG: D-sedoheptulose 7-phosphate isomerase [Candidatus Jettenia sp. AMX2]
MNDIKLHLQESIDTKKAMLLANLETIRDIANILIKTLKQNNCIYLIGNGGSAADAQHIAGELIGRFKLDRRPFPAIALTTDSSVITAIANDFGYDSCFSRQIEALVCPDDAVIAFSTSGNSKGIVNAVQLAKTLGAVTVGFTGKDGGLLKNVADICLKIPSDNTPRIQECHITVGHILCYLIEKEFFTI